VNQCEDGVKCTDPEHQKNRRTELKWYEEVFGDNICFVQGELKTPDRKPSFRSGVFLFFDSLASKTNLNKVF